MNIDENTKFIARLHKKQSGRGLNIYNPFFQDNNINAVYELFYDEDPAKLITGIRSLNFAGAIAAGFESNAALPNSLDGLDDVATFLGRVGYIKNVGGKYIGCNQGGEGLLNTILVKNTLENKEIVIVGAGNITKSLLFNMKKRGFDISKITIVNRTVSNAEELATKLGTNLNIKPLSELDTIKGDILINASDIGGSEEDILYTESIVKEFASVVDVTFERENTNLVDLGNKLNKNVSTGWDMFTHQALVVIDGILGLKIEASKLKPYVVKGLSEVV